MDKLTPKQKKFCEFYAANGGNGAAAARDAGYKQPEVQAAENLRKPYVHEYLSNLTRAGEKARIADATERQRFWTAVMNGEIGESKVSDRLKASELLGRAQGDFIERREVIKKKKYRTIEEIDARINELMRKTGRLDH